MQSACVGEQLRKRVGSVSESLRTRFWCRWNGNLYGDDMSCGCNALREAVEAKTDCECQSAGFCQRHKCTKNEHFFGLCKSNPGYFELWESGRGPCLQSAPLPAGPQYFGLGDLVGIVIHAVSFGRLQPWPGCGCDKRKAWLNKVRLWRISAT